MNLNATLLIQTVVFVILGWVTMKFIWPPLIRAIDDRRNKIADGLAAAERGYKELQSANSEAQVIINDAREKALKIVDQANRRSGEIIEEARGLGVRVAEDTPFARLIEIGGRVHGVQARDGQDHRADLTIIATGAWTPALLPHLGDVMWTTAQPVIHVDAGPDGRWRVPAFPVWAADIARTGWYGFPALASGAMKIGHHGSGRRLDPDGARGVLPAEEARVHTFLRDNLPALAGAPIVHRRLCLYCDTFDGDFWIDHDPDRPGLVAAAGDSGHGFKFAPILGGLIADVVEGKRNEWARRFAWRRRQRDSREAARAET